MALVARALDYFGVRKDLKNLTADLDAGRHHHMRLVLEQLIALRLLGGDAVSDTALLNEPAIKALFEWYEVAHRPPSDDVCATCAGFTTWDWKASLPG